MKKALLIFAMGAMLSMSANAQWFDFKNNCDRYVIGFNMGQVGTGTNYHDFGVGASIDIWGVYVDFINAGPEHKFDNHVGDYYWNDSVSWAVNAGYQIPVLPWLRVMPLVGYSQTNNGRTYANTLNVETNENSSSLYHDYNVNAGSRQHSFNFGGGIVVTPLKWFNVYAIYTRRAIYGGISINLQTFDRDIVD